MLKAYILDGKKLIRKPREAPIDDALWIDLFVPSQSEIESVQALGLFVPTLSDMEEIEISNRLYREDDAEYMTVVVPGLNDEKVQISAPVCFMLQQERLVTVRHHSPLPFETYPPRAGKAQAGCDNPAQILAGLTEEMIGRLADHLEKSGAEMDSIGRTAFGTGSGVVPQDVLQSSLSLLGAEGERLSRARLGLLTMGRALNHFAQGTKANKKLTDAVKTQLRDIDALQVHADFLSNRLAVTSDMLLGLINLRQSSSSRTASMVAVLFLPPTLIASTYGMNFQLMPELQSPWGYPVALIAMAASALTVWGIFRWKGWL